MKRFLFFSIALSLIAFPSCKDDGDGGDGGGGGGGDNGGCVESSGTVTIQSRAVAAFEAVELQADFDLELISGSGDLSIHAPEDLQGYILTTVVGDRLVISTLDDRCLSSPTPVRVVAKVPNTLHSVALESDGNINADGPLTLTGLSVSNSGGGNISMTGGCLDLLLDMDGDGEIRLFNMIGTNVTVAQRGSGKIECQVIPLGTLDISVSGSGSVYYKGLPLNYSENITGTGIIVDAN